MAVSDEQQQGGSLHAAISDAVVRITADYTGRGPTRARTTINGEWIFVTLEALTGRSVTAFLSDNHIDPDVAVECFQLAPRADGA
jgi:uncharacterized protein YbcI